MLKQAQLVAKIEAFRKRHDLSVRKVSLLLGGHESWFTTVRQGKKIWLDQAIDCIAKMKRIDKGVRTARKESNGKAAHL